MGDLQEKSMSVERFLTLYGRYDTLFRNVCFSVQIRGFCEK